MSSLAVELRPGVHALIGVVTVLHARGARIDAIAYATEGGKASMLVDVSGSLEDTERLAFQIDRRVDVLAVSVRPAVVEYR